MLAIGDIIEGEPLRRKKKTDYINNQRFYRELVEYKNVCRKAEEDGKPVPLIPKYIGESIYLICYRLSFKPNFINYTYKDEMISDALENCIQVVDKFNPDKSQNPFAYFTKIAWHAYIRRIHIEKKEQYLKHKNFENQFLLNDDYIGGSLLDEFCLDNDSHSNIISAFETKNAKQGIKQA